MKNEVWALVANHDTLTIKKGQSLYTGSHDKMTNIWISMGFGGRNAYSIVKIS